MLKLLFCWYLQHSSKYSRLNANFEIINIKPGWYKHKFIQETEIRQFVLPIKRELESSSQLKVLGEFHVQNVEKKCHVFKRRKLPILATRISVIMMSNVQLALHQSTMHF